MWVCNYGETYTHTHTQNHRQTRMIAIFTRLPLASVMIMIDWLIDCWIVRTKVIRWDIIWEWSFPPETGTTTRKEPGRVLKIMELPGGTESVITATWTAATTLTEPSRTSLMVWIGGIGKVIRTRWNPLKWRSDLTYKADNNVCLPRPDVTWLVSVIGYVMCSPVRTRWRSDIMRFSE